MLTYLKLMYETFLKDEEGASAIEYGLIIGLIAVVALAVLSQIGTGLDSIFSDVNDQVQGVGSGGDGGGN